MHKTLYIDYIGHSELNTGYWQLVSARIAVKAGNISGEQAFLAQVFKH